ncbi:MAG: hypothetical protein EZS28_023399, partial [Streblomastix strix]
MKNVDPEVCTGDTYEPPCTCNGGFVGAGCICAKGLHPSVCVCDEESEGYPIAECIFDKLEECKSGDSIEPGECKCIKQGFHPDGCVCADSGDEGCVCNGIVASDPSPCLTICEEGEFEEDLACLCPVGEPFSAGCKAGHCSGGGFVTPTPAGCVPVDCTSPSQDFACVCTFENHPEDCTCAEDDEEESTSNAVPKFTYDVCVATLAYDALTACTSEEVGDGCKCTETYEPIGCTYDPLRDPASCASGDFDNPRPFGCIPTACLTATATKATFPCLCSGAEYSPELCVCPEVLTGIPVDKCPCGQVEGDVREGSICPIAKVCTGDSTNCLCSAAHDTGACTCTSEHHNPDCVCDEITGAGYLLATCRADKPCVGSSTSPTGCTCAPVIADGATKVEGCLTQKKCNELTLEQLKLQPESICACYNIGDPRDETDGECYEQSKKCDDSSADLTDVSFTLCPCQPSGDERQGDGCPILDLCAATDSALPCVCNGLNVPAGCTCSPASHPKTCECDDDTDAVFAGADTCEAVHAYDQLAVCTADTGTAGDGDCQCLAGKAPRDCQCPLATTPGAYTKAICEAEKVAALPACDGQSSASVSPNTCKCVEGHTPENCVCPVVPAQLAT